jgi:hypothetical protein
MRAVLIVVAALLGWVGAPWWLAPLAGVALTIDAWWAKLAALAGNRGAPWSSKITTYFVTGLVSDIGLATLSYGFGRLLGGWLTA